jgi:hypothetical protein
MIRMSTAPARSRQAANVGRSRQWLRCPPSWYAEFHTVANAAALRVLPLGGYDCAVRQDIDDGTARPMKRGLERDRVRCVFEAGGGERAESRRT